MKKRYIILLLALIVGLFSWRFYENNIGVSVHGMEQDARESQHIDQEWRVTKSINDNLGAMVFYDEGLSDHTFSIYKKRGGMSYGYFFINGGSSSNTESGVEAFEYKKSIALLSLNKPRIVRIEYGAVNGEAEKTFNIDPDKPFAMVINKIDGYTSLKAFNEDGIEVFIFTCLMAINHSK